MKFISDTKFLLREAENKKFSLIFLATFINNANLFFERFKGYDININKREPVIVFFATYLELQLFLFEFFILKNFKQFYLS